MAAGDAPIFAVSGPVGRTPFFTPPAPLSPRLFNVRPVTPYNPAAHGPTGFGQIFSGISDAISSAPTAALNLGGQLAQSLVGFPRLARDVVTDPTGFSSDYGTNLREYFPALESFREGFSQTAHDVRHPSEYVKAWQQGQIVPRVLNDVANAAILAGPLAKGLTAAAGPEAVAAEAAAAPEARVAAQAAEGAPVAAPVASAAPRASILQSLRTSPSALAPEQVARPSLLRAAQTVESAAKPLETVGFAPARVWTAPLKAVTGFDLPFVRNAQDEPVRVGLRPLLQATGAEDAVRNIPAVANLEQRIGDWRTQRTLRGQVYDEALRPAEAQSAADLNRDAKYVDAASRAVGHDPELEHAVTIIHGAPSLRTLAPETAAALGKVAERYPQLAEQLPDWQQRVSESPFGKTQAPTERTLQVVNDYYDGTLDPKVRDQIDRSAELLFKPIHEQAKVKASTETDANGRLLSGHWNPLSPEQFGDTAMPSKVERAVEPLESRAEQLHRETFGYRDPVTGEQIPGLQQAAEQAAARVPEAVPSDLAASRALASARRAGALEGEAGAQERLATKAGNAAARYGTRAQQLEGETLAGARADYARHNGGDYVRESAMQSKLIGDTERAAGPGPYVVPDEEWLAARKVLRLEGEGATARVERAGQAAQRAEGRAVGKEQAATAAGGRFFTAGAEPVARGEWDPGIPDQPPPAGAKSTPDERVRVQDTIVGLRQRAGDNTDMLRDRLVEAMGSDKVPYIPERWYREAQQRGAPSAFEESEGRARARFKARQAGYGEAGGEYDWLAQITPDEWRLLRRHMAAPGEQAVAPDQWVQHLNSEGGSGLSQQVGDWNPSTAATEVIGRLKEYEAVRDVAAGKTPADAEAALRGLARTGTEPSVAERAVIENLPPRASKAGEKVTPKLVDAWREGQRAELADLHDQVLPLRPGERAPWTMTPDEYTAEMGDLNDVLRGAADRPVEQWSPDELDAMRRMDELQPPIVTNFGADATLTAQEAYARLRTVAQRVGEPVNAAADELNAVRAAGAGNVAEMWDVAREAVATDQETRDWFEQHGQQPDPARLAYTHLSADEKALYDAVRARGQADAAAGRADTARGNLTAGVRQSGETAGRRLGEAEGQQTAYTRIGGQAAGRAETVAGRVEPAVERAQRVAEQEVARPLRFGERRGKLLRDQQIADRQFRSAANRLDWLNDKIGAERARLEQGPAETAPARFIPGIAGANRFDRSWKEMATALAEQTQDPAAHDYLMSLKPDVLNTVDAIRNAGYDPEYLMGLVDEPTRSYVSGQKERIPYNARPTSERAKVEGTLPARYRTVLRGEWKETGDIVRNRAAIYIADNLADKGGDLIDRLQQDGTITPVEADAWRTGAAGARGEIGGLAAAMKRDGKVAWDPRSPMNTVPDSQVNADTLFLPTAVFDAYQRWWKSPGAGNPILRGYDFATRGFKHNVLAMSPRWHVWNILGNSFMATFGAGESPGAILRAVREAKQMRDREFDTGATELPAALKGAGATAENLRYMSEGHEPRTWFGRTIQKSYQLNETVDDLMHSAVYLAKKAKGYDEATAVQLSLRAMGDFQRLNPFERDYVRRVIPFYAWAKHVTQASFRLTAEHPFRVAWLMNLANTFGSNSQNLPDWLRGAQRLPFANWFENIGAANPYEGSVGSLWNNPKDLPTQVGRSLNPVLKNLAATVGGWDVSNMQPISRPPGTGNLDVYGTQIPTPLFGDPASWLQFTSRQVPAGKLFHDLADTRLFTRPSYALYDTGDVEKYRGQPRELQGGLASQLFHLGGDVGIPFLPAYYDEQQGNQRIIKGQRTALLARRRYFGS